MGALRFCLAAVVLLGHAPAIPGIGRYFNALLAVQIFFAVSGFFMQLILPAGGFTWPKIKSFYASRAMRLYPLFFVALVITAPLVLNFLPGRARYINLTTPDNVFVTGQASAILATVFTNLTMIGQDVMRFLAYDPAAGSFDFRPHDGGLPAYALGSSMQVMSQTWSIALELYFYALVPFILPRSTRFILALIALSVVARIYAFSIGFDGVNFVYAAFPFEIATFLAGAIACRLYLAFREKLESSVGGAVTISGAVIALLFGYWYNQMIPGAAYNSLKHWAGLIFFIAMLPVVFAHTRNWKIDRYIGDLSYPIYIIHIPVIIAVATFGMRMEWRGLFVVAATLLLSVVAKHFIQDPVDRLRRARFSRAVESGVSSADRARPTRGHSVAPGSV